MKINFFKKSHADLVSERRALDHEINAAIAFIQDLEEQRWDSIRNHASREDSLLFQALIRMGEKLARYTTIEKEHIWIAENVSRLSIMIRENQGSLIQLTDVVLKEIIKHLGANQGAIFLSEENDEHEIFLELKSAYAYERKKFLERRILPGEGLLGQCFVEEEKMYMTNVPPDYVNITSGLGEATPRCILLFPLKSNNRTVGVVELASFKNFTPVQFSFIDKVVENIAAAIINAKESGKVKRLLEESELMREKLVKREEELRQNFEELSSLQDDQIQKHQELEKANREIEFQKEEVIRIQKRETELMESKLKTQQLLSDKIIDKLKNKVEELQLKLKTQDQYKKNALIQLEA